MVKLRKEEIVAIQVVGGKGESHCALARRFNVSEGTVRYHLKRAREQATDGRKKPFLVERLNLCEVVKYWWDDQVEHLPLGRAPSVTALYDHLRLEYGYTGSYKSVRKYVRGRFPSPKMRPFRRIETPPGAQTQSDWAERRVDIGDPHGPTKLYAFVMVLSHSRKAVVIWSRTQDQLAWHHVHNEAYPRLGGVAAVNRIDNLKTGIVSGAGAWGKINAQYKVYARQLGFHIDANEPRSPEQKGKVEKRVQVLDRLDVSRRRFEGIEELQRWTDVMLSRRDEIRICPATGKTVHESWEEEKAFLRPLPRFLPAPFDLVKTCPVYKDCTVRFEGHTYAVPFQYMNEAVEVHGCSGEVQILDPETGEVVVRYKRGTKELLLIDPSCYEGKGTDRVLPPKPLGRMSRKLMEIAELPVEKRPVDLYAALAEVAR